MSEAATSDAVDRALRSIVGVPCEFTLATNSIKFRFDFQRSEKGRAYLWIDPLWRVTLAGRLVTGSNDCPVWDEGAPSDVNRPPWLAWCALFEPMRDSPVMSASVWGVADLCLVLASGHRLETFGHYREGVWWYYRDRFTGVVYEATADGMRFEQGEPAESIE